MAEIQHKFLSDIEQQIFQNDPRLITVAWCAKEAVYKWQGRRGVEFIDHLQIGKVEDLGNESNIIFNLLLTARQMEIITKSCIKANTLSGMEPK